MTLNKQLQREIDIIQDDLDSGRVTEGEAVKAVAQVEREARDYAEEEAQAAYDDVMDHHYHR